MSQGKELRLEGVGRGDEKSQVERWWPKAHYYPVVLVAHRSTAPLTTAGYRVAGPGHTLLPTETDVMSWYPRRSDSGAALVPQPTEHNRKGHSRSCVLSTGIVLAFSDDVDPPVGPRFGA
jgi:hypothetical protein